MIRISPTDQLGVFIADEEDLQFFVSELPNGSYGVTCEECRNAGKEPHVWTFRAFPLVLIGMREHRREHFGLPPNTPT
jgi:hypothetical protein